MTERSTETTDSHIARSGGGSAMEESQRAGLLRRPKSIVFLTALWYTATILVLLGASYGTLYYFLHAELTEQYDRFLDTYANDLDAKLHEFEPGSKTQLASWQHEVAYFRQARVEYRVADENGRSIFRSQRWPQGSTLPAADGRGEIEILGIAFHSVTRSVRLSDGQLWRTQTAVSLNRLRDTLTSFRRAMAFLSLPFVLVSLGGGIFLAKKVLRPVQTIAATARDISSHNLCQRLPLRGTGDELDVLAGAINGMLARLEESFDRIERFSSELAHELRTPLTLLVCETEAALISNPKVEELRELLVRHAELYQSMRNLTTDVLRLLRDGTRSEKETMSVTNLACLCEDVATSFRLLAEDRGIRLDFDADKFAVNVFSNPPSIQRLVSNLLDNAIRHSRPGGRVSLTVKREKDAALIVVCDDGEGIATADLPRVFDRFVRGEGTGVGEGSGFGLGLAIVKQIAEQHGGSVHIESALGESTLVRVTLPLHR